MSSKNIKDSLAKAVTSSEGTDSKKSKGVVVITKKRDIPVVIIPKFTL